MGGGGQLLVAEWRAAQRTHAPGYMSRGRIPLASGPIIQLTATLGNNYLSMFVRYEPGYHYLHLKANP